MKKLIIPAVVAAAAVIYVGCSNSEAKKGVGIDIANIDSSSTPGNDFFQFANGGWIKANPIPNDQVRWGSFPILAENNRKNLASIADEASRKSDASKGSPEQLVGDFYFAAMDTVTIEKLGASPIKGEMDAIEKITDISSLLNYVAKMQQWGASPMFGFYAGQDPKNSEVNVPQLVQGGISLPDRDYYSSPDKANIRSEYMKHVTTMFGLYGYDKATSEKCANTVMKIETALANSSMRRVELRDPFKTYNKVSIDDLNTMTPSIKWDVMMKNMNINGKYDYLILGQPEFLKELHKQLQANSMDEWKVYLKWNLINTYAGNLSKPYEDQNFEFYGKQLSGQKEQKPRWKRIVQETNGALGELIGQEFVDNYLPKNTKEKLTEIAKNIVEVYKEHIQKLDWMGDSTKQKALYKLSKVTLKMGYPDKWKDMSSVEINKNEYLKNMMRVSQWGFKEMINRYGKPIDKERWDMTPQTYNAYYQPTANEIVIPGCNIIVPGFAKGEMPDDAILYAIIGGSTIGHEITHGFDDQGSQYDAEGNLKTWWTAADRKNFEERSKKLAEQYNLYTVKADSQTLNVRGYATLGENIADLGGAVMGYEAFMKTKQAKEGKKINGFTPEQRYFLGFAYSWMVQRTDKSMAMQIMSDVHSPAMYRINGPMSNMPEFFAAFGIKEGEAMYRKEVVKIW